MTDLDASGQAVSAVSDEGRISVNDSGSATASNGGFANTGVVEGNVTIEYHQAAGPLPPVEPVRSAYLEQVARIAPAELLEREAELAALRDFCTAPDADVYLWLRAPAWVGKSALIAWFVLHPPQDVRLVSFFVTARLARQDDSVAFADVVLEQLLTLLGRPAPALLTPATREAHLLAVLEEAAADCQARGERLVLVVDGLDEDHGTATGPDGHSIAALLPARPTAGLRVIVTGRPNPPLPPDVPPGHPLRDPAIVRPLTPSPHAAVIRTTAQHELKRLLAADNPDGDLLAFVAAAGGGLSAADLAELTGRRPWQVEDRLGAVAGRTFTVRRDPWASADPRQGDQPGGTHQRDPNRAETYVLGHEELQREALALLGDRALDARRQQLHDWADTYRRRRWPVDTPGYLLQGYLGLLLNTMDLPRIVALATDSTRHARLLDRSGADGAALTEIVAAQDALAGERRPDLVALARLAVHRSVLTRRNRNIPVPLPALWARLGESARADALARSIPDPTQRDAALAAIAEATATPAVPSPPPPAEPADRTESPGLTVEALVDEARTASRRGDTDRAGHLLRAAERSAFASTDPDERAALWNSIVWARRRPDLPSDDEDTAAAQMADVRTLDPWRVEDDLFERAAVAAADAGEFDQAEAVADAIRNRRHDVLEMIALAAVAAGDVVRAERLSLSFGPSALAHVARAMYERGDQTRARTWIDAAAAEAFTGGRWFDHTKLVSTLAAVGDAEQAVARAMAVPDPFERMSSLAAIATATSEHTEACLAALAEALVRPEPDADTSQWDAWLSAVRAIATLGDIAVAEVEGRDAAKAGRADGLVTVALIHRERGNVVEARTALADAVVVAARQEPAGRNDPLYAAVTAMAELGDADTAAAAAVTAAEPYRRHDALCRIAEAAADAGHIAAAERAAELIRHPSGSHDRLDQKIALAHAVRRDYAAATAATSRIGNPEVRARAVPRIASIAIEHGDLGPAEEIAREHGDLELLILVADGAVTAGENDRGRALLDIAAAAARAVPDPQWQAETLASAACTLTADPARSARLTAAAEHAARLVTDPAQRAQAFVAVAMALQPPAAAALLAEVGPLTCGPVERLADRVRVAVRDTDHATTDKLLAVMRHLSATISNPDERSRAEQAHVAAAIAAGNLDAATEVARAINHPDQRALALAYVASAGSPARAIELATAIDIPDRRTDTLIDAAARAAAAGDLTTAEQAAAQVRPPSGAAHAWFAIVLHGARTADLDRLTRDANRIDDHPLRQWAHRILTDTAKARTAGTTQSAPTNAEPRASSATPEDFITAIEDARRDGRFDLVDDLIAAASAAIRATSQPSRRRETLLLLAQTAPEHPACSALIAETLRTEPITAALDALARIHRVAATSAADELLALLT
ncbi:hypothetical protein [Dactylosporangium sp. NPDC006015]|uniref:hypothetical protein n=1 Tax=Dactylosporangium sp. NPDC006015 TaxID=3154576 RepID=UPI0033BAB0EB